MTTGDGSSASLARLRRFAYLLDGVGLDPLLGLIPGAGDAAGAVLSAWVLIEAFRLGASRATLLRMAGNVALDAGLGHMALRLTSWDQRGQLQRFLNEVAPAFA